MADAPTPDTLRPGETIGRWRIEGYAGRGTYGAVYRARLAGPSGFGPVALKLAVFAYDPRFLREARVLSRIHHPSVPQLLDQGWWIAGPRAAHPYLVLEWIHGLPLYEWAHAHPPTTRQVLQVVAQIGSALDALHQDGCLHRDVKGDNILVDPAGRAVLMDYGSSTWAGAPPITESLMPPNTREYRSPEALRFEWGNWRTQGARYEARPADDLYALGVSTYRLVTSMYPPPGTAPEALKEHLREAPPRRVLAQRLNERVRPELASVIEGLLADEPENRGLASEVCGAAELAAQELEPSADMPLLGPQPPALDAVVVPVPPVPRPAREAWRGVAAIAGLVLLVAGGLGVYRWFPVETPGVAPAARLDEDMPPTAEPTGLGDSAPSSPKASKETSASGKVSALEVPSEPLPGQRRAPCQRRGDVEINGGCWAKFALTPPCGDDKYEWKGACYGPLFERSPPRTSQQPR